MLLVCHLRLDRQSGLDIFCNGAPPTAATWAPYPRLPGMRAPPPARLMDPCRTLQQWPATMNDICPGDTISFGVDGLCSTHQPQGEDSLSAMNQPRHRDCITLHSINTVNGGVYFTPRRMAYANELRSCDGSH